jgi:hypothetical protein
LVTLAGLAEMEGMPQAQLLLGAQLLQVWSALRLVLVVLVVLLVLTGALKEPQVMREVV